MDLLRSGEALKTMGRFVDPHEATTIERSTATERRVGAVSAKTRAVGLVIELRYTAGT